MSDDSSSPPATLEEDGTPPTTLPDVEQDLPSPREYPDVFYCPTTRKLLKDPVVLADGISYERTAVPKDATLVYSNRGLKTMLEDATRNKLQKLQQKAVQLIYAERTRPLPDSFYCPITLGLMHEPVIDPQGYTYEKVAIENWIRVNGDSPVTRATLTTAELVPNRAIATLLQAEANKKDDSIHPAILKWKSEPPPVALELDTSVAATVDPNDDDAEQGTVTTTTRAPPPARQASFPMTPEQFAAQQQVERRRHQARIVCRIVMLLAVILVLVCAFFAPIFAAVTLVVVMLGICWVTTETTRVNDGFRRPVV